MIKNIGMILMIAGVLALMGCSADESYNPEQVVYNALNNTSASVPYYAEAEMKVIENGEETEHLLVKQWADKDGRRRVETQHADGSGLNIGVYDGTKLINYQPETKQVFYVESDELLELTQLTPKDQAEYLLRMIRNTHDISVAGEEEIAGRKGYHLIAKTKDAQSLLGDQELWIDMENWMVLKMISISGNMKKEIVYTTFDLNPKLTANLFTLNLPEDVQIVNLDEMNSKEEISLEEAAEVLGEPFLYFSENEGIKITKVAKIELNGELNRNEINIDYTLDGFPSFTLTIFPDLVETEEESFELPGEQDTVIRGQTGEYMEMGDFRSLVWSENGLRYSVLFIDPNMTLEQFVVMADQMVRFE